MNNLRIIPALTNCLLLTCSLTTIAQSKEFGKIGWNYTVGHNLSASDEAGAEKFAQKNWNNHQGSGQGPGALPFALHDDQGAATSASVTDWKLSKHNSWKHDESGNPNAFLMNNFSGNNAEITFSNIPYSNYSIVVYYGDNQAATDGSTGTISVGQKSLKIRTGDSAASSYLNKGYLEGTEKNSEQPSNYSVFSGLFQPQITVSMSSDGNNGLSAIQIIEGKDMPESDTAAKAIAPLENSTNFKPWQSLQWQAGGAKEMQYAITIWQDGSEQPKQATAILKSTTFTPEQYLEPGTKYRWQVATQLQSGRILSSDIFSFTTADMSQSPAFDISANAQKKRTDQLESLYGIAALTSKSNGTYAIPQATTLAFYGDSITDVYSYFDPLQQALEAAHTKDNSFPKVTFLNRGINGATTADLLTLSRGDRFSGGSGPANPLPFKKQVDADLKNLAQGETYLAIIQIGINDVYQGDNTPKASYKTQVLEMVDYVLEKGHRVALLSPTGVNEIPTAQITNDGQHDDSGNALLNDYTAALQEIADERGLAFVDQRAAYHLVYQNENFAISNNSAGEVSFPQNNGILSGDGVHPNARGKVISSELAATAILNTFSDSSSQAKPILTNESSNGTSVAVSPASTKQLNSKGKFLPTPKKITLSKGYFKFSKNSRIIYTTRKTDRKVENSLQSLAELLAHELEIRTGSKPRVVEASPSTKPSAGDIVLEFSKIKGDFAATEIDEDQSYQLTIGDTIRIRSAYYKGVSYGTVTLQQAIAEKDAKFYVKKQRIEDEPTAAYRTMMLDLARQPSQLDMVREVIRLSRHYKIRYLQLHLTDDQHFTFPFKPITDKLENNFVYSREDLIELSNYADQHGVTIIPELDLPGHSSKLRASGYLSPSNNDADVADPANYTKIYAIIDDMLEVFPSSPYFHIGGDESGAGEKLVPFLAAMNKHLRSKAPADRKRLLVWEGFHGSPTKELPATGDDRIVVIAWEHRYNTPWNLLNNGYEIVNASWQPLYIVGSGSTSRYPHVSQRMWSPEIIHAWDKNTFTHWQPGIPVFEDQGENDKVKGDRSWNSDYIGKSDLVIGGQMLSWEQNEKTIVRDLLPRLPAMADRLWNPIKKEDFAQYQERFEAIEEGVMAIVKPVEILPLSTTPDSPVSADYRQYDGDEIELTILNRTKIPGTIRYEIGNFNNQATAPGFDTVKATSANSTAYSGPFTRKGGFGIRAALYRGDNGEQLEGHDWQHYNNWKNKVNVTEYEVPAHPMDKVPDFSKYSEDKILRKYTLPYLHGPYMVEKVKGNMYLAQLDIPQDGEYEISVQTSDGRSSIYIDQNDNDKWEKSDQVIEATEPDGKFVRNKITLKKGVFTLRVDHASGAIGGLMWVKISGPGLNGEKDISDLLLPIK